MKVLLTGATGFLGRRIAAELASRGHVVLRVSRKASPGVAEHDWSPASLERGVDECEAIVHLAGANLFARRWTDAYKREIVASRVETTRALAELVAKRPEKSIVSASAVGFYGSSEHTRIVEGYARGAGFLADVCVAWEDALEPARRAGAQVTVVRFGVVLGKEGGALAAMLPIFRAGLGGRVGSGAQWLAWIHHADACRIVAHALASSKGGVYNATAPEPVRQRDFARSLARALHRPAFVPVPEPLLRLALGEAADALLTGAHVTPARALREGFAFRFPTIDEALADLFGQKA